jgi:hypothetical protein
MKDLELVVWLFAPLFAGLAANGVCIRYGLAPSLARPIDAGRTWRGTAIFGTSKTWRGLAAVSAGTSAAYVLRAALASTPPALFVLASLPAALVFGALLGLAAMLSELVNSFVKRRLGIAPGAAARRGLRRVPLYVLDQLDFLLVAWPVAAIVVTPTPSRLLWSAAFVLAAHQAVSVAGAALGMRESAR